MVEDIKNHSFSDNDLNTDKKTEKTELADSLKLAAGEYFIEKLSEEEKKLLEKTNDVRLAAVMWENQQLKRENTILKRKAPTRAPQLDSQGAAGNNDPFTAGFIGAMDEY